MNFDTFLSLTLLGIAGGGLYGMLGTSVAVFYRATGVVNFAVAASAMYTAFVYNDLAQNGRLALPWVQIGPIPSSIAIAAAGLPVWLSATLALVVIAAFSAAAYLLIFRPLRDASGLAKLIASVGLLLYLQATAQINFGVNSVQPPSILPSTALTNFLGLGGPMPVARLWIIGIAVCIAGGLVIFYRRTRTGKATRAAADNEKGAVLLGFSRVWLGVLSAVVSGLVAGIAGILVSPITSLDTVNFTLFIVPALAAALVGGLSFPMTVTIAGVGLGVIQTAAVAAGGFSWYPGWLNSGASDVVPFLVIVVVMFVRSDRIPDRSSLSPGVLPLSPISRHPVRSLALGGVGLAVLVFTLGGTWQFALDTSLVGAILMLSYVVIVGWIGQISVAQLALAGIGGFALVRFGTNPPGANQQALGLPFPVAAILAILVATAVGIVVGLPALRLRGQQLVIVSLTAATTITTLIFANPSITGVPLGSTAIAPLPKIGPLNLSIRNTHTGLSDRWEFAAFAAAVLLMVSFGLAQLRKGRTGRQFLAVRSNERAAAASGIVVARTKLFAFGLSSAIAGCAGVLIATQQTQIDPTQFDVFTSIIFLSLVTIGGIAALSGAYFGAIVTAGGLVAAFIALHLSGLENYIPLISAIAVLLQIVTAPSGVVIKAERDLRRLLIRVGSRWKIDTTKGHQSTFEDVAGVTAMPTGWMSYFDSPTDVGERLLDVSGLTVAYGGVVACDNLSLSVAQGQLVGLIGPNGAGKTSLIDAISGFASIRDGSSIVLGGENIEKLRPHDRYLRGMARTFQAAELFDELSVFENLLVTADRPRWNDPLRDLVTTSSDEALGTARFALEAVGLQHKAEAKASELSMGDRKLAAVARALAGRPRILLLDEPAAGLDTDESRVLGQLLQKIVASGASILLIDHDINLVFDICDWIYVLDFGCVIASGEPEAVRADEAVIDAYLGRAANDASAEFAEQPMDLL